MSEREIPADAIEAAVEALLASKLGDHAGINGEEFVEAAQAAIEAAAPYLMAKAWDEGGEARMEREYAYGAEEKAKYANPYLKRLG